MRYDVIVIGGGLSGLTAAALLSKRGLKVAVIDKSYNPGGSCGIFKRDQAIFDQGAAMLFGFGEKGFNAHRFVFNCMEEPIDMIRHDLLYCVNFKGTRIRFWPDIERFAEELAEVFPTERGSIKRFYKDLELMYQHVMVENPAYTTPDETDPKISLKNMAKHPVSYARFLGYMNKSAKSLLEKYFSDPEIFKFFDKLTSTYCYATLEESPAVLAAVMFVDNHIGGSYYPAGSTVFLPGKLEKVIEENGGDMILEAEVVKILFDDRRPSGVLLQNGLEIFGENLVYSGTVWNLYGKLIEKNHASDERRAWAAAQLPTYPSVVLYALVDRRIIPEDTAPIEMLIGNPERIDESEVTAYISSVDDRTLCDTESHVVVAIGPTFEKWDIENDFDYRQKKDQEMHRLIAVLERRFPGFQMAVKHAEIATPKTIERYTNKNGGAVAGPKQMLGQHMLKRLHTRTEWDNLFCCGESTVMGTGTPTVTASGISAANAILTRSRLEPYIYKKNMANYVRILDKPVTEDRLLDRFPPDARTIMLKASACQICENPSCSENRARDIRGIMRRTMVGNFAGARKILNATSEESAWNDASLADCESKCILKIKYGTPVEIKLVIDYIKNLQRIE